MWKTFTLDGTKYIIKTYLDDKYKILLTDLSNLWIEEFTKEEICSRCKELNLAIETDDDTFLNTTIALLTDVNCDVTYNIELLEDSAILTCKSRLEEIYFIFKVFLKKSNDLLLFSKEFTKPLIYTVTFLENRQDHLLELIAKKDIEIKRHVFENGPISKKKLVTETFNKEDAEFSPTHLCLKILSEFSDVETANIKVKNEEEKPQIKKRKTLSLAQKVMFKKKKQDNK